MDCKRTAYLINGICRDLARITYRVCMDSCPPFIPGTFGENRRECYDACQDSYDSQRKFCKEFLKKNEESCDEDYENCKDDCPPITQR
jgi:hypothetical protein